MVKFTQKGVDAMKNILALNFGSGDAEAYKRREKKEFLNKVFLKDDIDRLVEPDKYFLIGEKGTGKTAISVYLQNNDYKNTVSRLKFIRETDYTKFVDLKKHHSIILSDYTIIWKVILLLLISEEIKPCLSDNPIGTFIKFLNLKRAIDEYYDNAFDPEILDAMSMIENVNELVLNAQYLSGKATQKESIQKKEFKSNLIDLKNLFEEAFKTIRVKKNFNLFIDGIDIRPPSIEHEGYIECIKGLTHATWELNQDFFSNLKGNGECNIKVVLLIRPDIFVQMGLQNTNNKIRDNSLLLDWKTTYQNYQSSKLYKLANKILYEQQDDKKLLISDEMWNYYFNYNVEGKNGSTDHSFVGFLRDSFYRPRDLVAFMQEMQSVHEKNGNSFSNEDYRNAKSNFSNYLLGEIKDYMIFYYDNKQYELFLKFFQYLHGKVRFEYREYLESYQNFKKYADLNANESIPEFMDTADNFLQFLFELNIIAYVEQTDNYDSFFHWCFRERNYANLTPKVKYEVNYRIHPGLTTSLSLGRKKKS